MASKNAKANIRKNVTLSFSLKECVSYADYYLGKSVFSAVKICNGNPESVKNLSLSFRCDKPLLIENAFAAAEIPFEGAVEIAVPNILSPLFLSDAEEETPCTVTAELSDENGVFSRVTRAVKVLPVNGFCGIGFSPEYAAPLVRPALAECGKVLSSARAQLKKWNADGEELSYQGNGKDDVRLVAAAVCAAVRQLDIGREEGNNLAPALVRDYGEMLAQKKATPLELSLFLCACLERAGLNAVLFFGEKSAAVGVWLYNTCFLDASDDDMAIVSNYTSEGIHNLACFCSEDFFASSRAGYELSEKHFHERLALGEYLLYADIKRCRLSGFLPLPLKIKTEKGYEIVSAEETSPDEKPLSLASFAPVKEVGALPKNKQWERRLLDLSLKNTLLSFNANRAVQILSADAGETLAAVKKGELTLLPLSPEYDIAAEPAYRSSSRLARYRNLIAAEHANGLLRALADGAGLADSTAKLLKKSRDAYEETGCNILYLAFGFLKWTAREDGKERYAPLCLLPVRLKKNKGNSAYAVCFDGEDEAEINSTLLEFLKREFNVDVRGLDGSLAALSLAEIFAMVRAEISSMKGWDVTDDVFLSVFSFSRFTMWRDVRENMAEFQKNPVVSSLLHNVSSVPVLPSSLKGEDEAEPSQTLSPLPADSSQFEAVAYSQTGNTFVLHGPPGTGKSQTITNMIANALYEGKQVLFVAEKQAALEVVKKRLDGIGLGDFCLELHSAKAGKADVLKKLEDTLSLSGAEEPASFEKDARALAGLRKLIEDPHSALHQTRRLGVSVYEGIARYLENKNAPDLLAVETAFYDALTAEKLTLYENLLAVTAASARECGEVSRSPFANVNLTVYTREKRDEVYCASQVMLNEIRHLKNYLSLFLELYRQKISRLTREKLSLLSELNDILLSDYLTTYCACGEEEFSSFFRANIRLDYIGGEYAKKFRRAPRLPKDAAAFSAALVRACEEGYAFKKYKEVYAVYKKVVRAALKKPRDGEEAKALLELVGEEASCRDTLLASPFRKEVTDGRGKLSEKRRAAFFAPVKKAHALAGRLFMDYNADSFNSACVRAASGYARTASEGLKNALFSFGQAERGFLAAVNADPSKMTGDEILDYYTDKAETLAENIDKLSSWCAYKRNVAALDKEGLKFAGECLESGLLSSDNVLSAFRKNVYRYFAETNIAADPVLSSFSAAVIEEAVEKYRLTNDDFCLESRKKIRKKLIAALPRDGEAGEVSGEIAFLKRVSFSRGRGMTLREIFPKIPAVLRRAAPCLLMSPVTVSQYLEPKNGLFDMVIFDEASQMPTSEAVASLARAKSAVIVGDPKQLPPTSFFSATYADADDPENGDMESILDDALALGLPQRYLTWHYRSKHESLIAFSNVMYYENRLSTFPSPDSLDSRVKLVKVAGGAYERGGSKRNAKEAEALIAEVVRRLSDPVLQKESIGIVTFSGVQKEYIEKKLAHVLFAKGLEDAAYEREEPLFVKNLENVQGDERDVILFSVCYGPDNSGRLSLNFGPLNQEGGWRRLNVAVSRARSEMLIFSSMTASMIDLSRTSSKGVAGLKAFLEFAEKGKTTLAVRSDDVVAGRGIGKYIAEELARYGYECRYDVGVSRFKIDVAVVDPNDKHKFILAVLLDGSTAFSIKDRNLLQVQTLRRNNWNVIRLYTVNYFSNPKREIKKIKDLLDRLAGAEKKDFAAITRYKKPYKAAVLEQRSETSAYIVSGENDTEILSRLQAIVATEEPLSEKFLIKRTLSSLGVIRPSLKAEARLKALLRGADIPCREVCSERYYYKDERVCALDCYRVEGEGEHLRKSEADVSAFEFLSFVKAVLEERVSVRADELVSAAAAVFEIPRTDRLASFLSDVIRYGENQGLLLRSVSDRISLA